MFPHWRDIRHVLRVSSLRRGLQAHVWALKWC